MWPPTATHLLDLGVNLGRDGELGTDLLKDLGVVRLDVRDQSLLELADALDVDLVKVTVDTGVDDNNLVLNRHGLVLGLLEQLSETGTTVEQELGRSVQVGTELGEGGDLTVLGKEKLERTGDLLHGLDLGSGTDTRHGETDVDGRADTLEEQLGFQENLTVRDGNHVGGNVGGHITTLGLDDGEGGERASAETVVHLGGTLKETRVEVEHVTTGNEGRSALHANASKNKQPTGRPHDPGDDAEAATSDGKRRPAWTSRRR